MKILKIDIRETKSRDGFEWTFRVGSLETRGMMMIKDPDEKLKKTKQRICDLIQGLGEI